MNMADNILVSMLKLLDAILAMEGTGVIMVFR